MRFPVSTKRPNDARGIIQPAIYRSRKEERLESPAVLRKCKYAFLTLPSYSLVAVANARGSLFDDVRVLSFIASKVSLSTPSDSLQSCYCNQPVSARN
jgi:hypothetical protein